MNLMNRKNRCLLEKYARAEAPFKTVANLAIIFCLDANIAANLWRIGVDFGRTIFV